MKKILTIICAFLCFASFSFVVKANGVDDVPYEYCSNEKATFVYETVMASSDFSDFLKENKLSISKDKIMPVYYFNLLDYARNNEIDIKPMVCKNHNNSSSEEGCVYAARVNMPDNEYAGYIEFCIEDGTAFLHYFCSSHFYEMSIGNEYYSDKDVYIDFYDNESVFYDVFLSDDALSEHSIQLVFAEGLGIGFYASSLKTEDVFIYPKTMVEDVPIPTSYMLVDNELKARADADLIEYSRVEQQYKEWRKDHPDEEWDYIGYFKYPLDFLKDSDEKSTKVNTSTEKNVSLDNKVKVSKTDVEEKQSLDTETKPAVDYSKGDSSKKEKNTSNIKWMIPLICIFVIIIVGIILYNKRKVGKYS